MDQSIDQTQTPQRVLLRRLTSCTCALVMVAGCLLTTSCSRFALYRKEAKLDAPAPAAEMNILQTADTHRSDAG